MGLSRLMRGQYAQVFNGRVAAELVHEYRWHIRGCAAFFIASLLAAVLVYKLGWVAKNDWRALALAFGGGVAIPVSVLFLWLPRRRFAEYWIAIAVKESFRPWVMTLVFVLCTMAFASGIAGYVFD